MKAWPYVWAAGVAPVVGSSVAVRRNDRRPTVELAPGFSKDHGPGPDGDYVDTSADIIADHTRPNKEKHHMHYTNYGATMFRGPQCSGQIGYGPVQNFACHQRCFPMPGVLSVLLEGDFYDVKPKIDDSRKQESYGVDGYRNRYRFIHNWGPAALVFGTSQCDQGDFLVRAVIPRYHNAACITFNKPAYGMRLHFQKMCRPEHWVDLGGMPPQTSNNRVIMDFNSELAHKGMDEWDGRPTVRKTRTRIWPVPANASDDESHVHVVTNTTWLRIWSDQREPEEQRRQRLQREALVNKLRWQKADQHDLMNSWREKKKPRQRPTMPTTDKVDLGVIWGDTAQDDVGGHDREGESESDTDSDSDSDED